MTPSRGQQRTPQREGESPASGPHAGVGAPARPSCRLRPAFPSLPGTRSPRQRLCVPGGLWTLSSQQEGSGPPRDGGHREVPRSPGSKQNLQEAVAKALTGT